MQRTTIRLISNLMKEAGVDVEKAMELLQINIAERNTYRDLVGAQSD